MRTCSVFLFLALAAAWMRPACGQSNVSFGPGIAQSNRVAGTITTNASTLAVSTTGWATASVTLKGTYAGVTVNFETSDNGTDWYADACTRSDVALQESSEVVASNATRAWDCAVYGTTGFRVRSSAYTSGTGNVGITLSGVYVEPAATVTAQVVDSAGNGITSTANALDINIKSNSVANANPCMSGFATIQSVAGATSGTASVQLVAISGTTKIYVCSMQVTSVSGTSPTFALRYGTGSACATGTVTLFGPTAALTVGQIVGPNFPFAVTIAGQALCYIQTGTTPIANYAISYVQQ